MLTGKDAKQLALVISMPDRLMNLSTDELDYSLIILI